MSTRKRIYREAIDLLVDAVGGQLWDDEYEEGHRFLLLEQSNVDPDEWAASLWDTIEHAFRESAEQEFAQDWEPRFLVDLDTGETSRLARRYTVAFDGSSTSIAGAAESGD